MSNERYDCVVLGVGELARQIKVSVPNVDEFSQGKHVAMKATKLPNKAKWLRGRCMITVDRSIRPTYPNMLERILYPEFENTGPTKFDMRTIEQWVYRDQLNKRVSGNDIHWNLKNSNLLENCLSLRDLEEIRKKGYNFFRKYFTSSKGSVNSNVLFAWKSVVKGNDGLLYVPDIEADFGKRIEIRWMWLNHWFTSIYHDASYSALCFSD